MREILLAILVVLGIPLLLFADFLGRMAYQDPKYSLSYRVRTGKIV
jgi:hypothetical protein